MDQNQQNGMFNTEGTEVQQANALENAAPVNTYGQPNPYQQQFNQQATNANQQANPYQQTNYDPLQDYQAPSYNYNFTPIKKKFNPLVVIIPVLVVIIAVVAVILLFSGKSSYRKAEQQFFSALNETALSSAEETEEKINSQPQSLKLKVSLPSELSVYLGGISSVDLNMDVAANNDKAYGKGSLALGEAKIIMEYWMDSLSGNAYILLPEASDIYAAVEANSYNNSSNDVDYEELSKAFSEILSKTMETYFEEVGDPKTENNQEFTVEGVTITADKAAVHLNAAQMAKIITTFRDNLLDSDTAMSILTNLSGLDSRSELEDSIKEAFDEEKLNEIIDGKENNAAFDMIVYMQKNEIVGREITITNDDEEKVYVNFYDVYANDGEEIVYLNVNSTNDDKTFKAVIKDKFNGTTSSGTVNITTPDDDTFKISYSDLAISDTMFQGSATVTMSGEEAFTANVELSSEGEEKTVMVKIPNICTVTLIVAPSDIEFKEFPNPAEDKVFRFNEDIDYDDPAFQQFTDDLYDYLEDVLSPVLGGLMGGGYDDYYDDGYDETFGGYGF